MEEKAAETVAAPAAAAAVVAVDLDVTYCSEHPYPPGAAAAAGMAVGSGICAFCLQEKLGMLVSSSKSSPFHPPPASVTPTTPPSNRPSYEPLSQPSAATGMALPLQKAKAPSSSAATLASGLRRSKSVAPRPEEPPLSSAGVTSDSPRKKSFWSFLYPSSSSGRHRSASSSSLGSGDGSPASARRKSVSVASATSASLGRRLEAIEEPESPGRRSEGSSSSFGRKVARSRSVGCGSRSFSGDFLERLSTGFGDCALRRVESHREPKPKVGSARLGHLGGDGDDDYEYSQQHRIKCAGFFGAAPPPSSSSYWLSAPPNGGSGVDTGSNTRMSSGTRSHRSWAWALASPMRALRPTSSASSKTLMSAHHNRAVGNNGNMPTAGGSAVATS